MWKKGDLKRLITTLIPIKPPYLPTVPNSSFPTELSSSSPTSKTPHSTLDPRFRSPDLGPGVDHIDLLAGPNTKLPPRWDKESETYTRESDRISMTSRSSIPGERKSPIILPARVEEVVMVQYPQWVNTLHLRVRTLLPIKPPEIDSLIFEWVMELF